MNVAALIDRLERFPPVLTALVGMVTPEQARLKPASGAWSILEIVCHLGDEETDDFRARLRMTLEDPTIVWPKTDPEAAARDGRYNERDLRHELDRFIRERGESVKWLRSLAAPNWNNTVVRSGRTMRAGDLMVSWVAHDALHIRQTAKRLYELAAADGQPEGFGTRYAGEWGV